MPTLESTDLDAPAPIEDRRRQVDRASEDLRMTSIVLSELANAQQRLLQEMHTAVAAMPNQRTLESYRAEAEALRDEVHSGQARLRNLLLAEGLAFLTLAATFVVTFAR